MRTRLHQVIRVWIIAVGIFSLVVFSTSVLTCEPAVSVRTATLEEVKNFFAKEKKKVVTFIGYSGSGYEDKAKMLDIARNILGEFNPSKTFVNIGATPDGIGSIYELAKDKGFVTTGIVSTQAKKYDAKLSKCVDYVFYVEDATWGGFVEGSDRLSPTSTAMVGVSDILIGIGGGEVARDELTGARRLGKEVRFFSADMDHQKAREKAEKKNLPEPMNFRGAADERFSHKQAVD